MGYLFQLKSLKGWTSEGNGQVASSLLAALLKSWLISKITLFSTSTEKALPVANWCALLGNFPVYHLPDDLNASSLSYKQNYIFYNSVHFLWIWISNHGTSPGWKMSKCVCITGCVINLREDVSSFPFSILSWFSLLTFPKCWLGKTNF